MGAIATIKGTGNEIKLSEKLITKLDFEVLTPQDSNARSTDVTYLLRIEGRIIPELGGSSGEVATELSNWSRVNQGVDVYRHVEASFIGAGTVVRHYELTKAFVQDYDEQFTDTEGTGTFILELCQKKDHNKEVKVNGGYPE